MEQKRFIGISVSPLRTGERRTTGYVFNFQDLTDLRHLEREVATKDRMAALGRLSAAIAHEIRQPLTAWRGAVKELGRLVPLQEDEQHLVGIVSRESERLNKIITDFLNYSREKTYEFSEDDVACLLDETLTLFERNPQLDGKYRIERAFAAPKVHIKVDRNRIKQVFWNLSDNALRAMPDGGVLSVSLELAQFWVRIRFRDTGVGLIPSRVPRYSSPCNRHLWVERVSAWPSFIRLFKRTADELAWSRKKTVGRNLSWNSRVSHDLRAIGCGLRLEPARKEQEVCYGPYPRRR